jgi:hypothetical protein
LGSCPRPARAFFAIFLLLQKLASHFFAPQLFCFSSGNGTARQLVSISEISVKGSRRDRLALWNGAPSQKMSSLRQDWKGHGGEVERECPCQHLFVGKFGRNQVAGLRRAEVSAAGILRPAAGEPNGVVGLPASATQAGTCLNEERDSARIPAFPTMGNGQNWPVN